MTYWARDVLHLDGFPSIFAISRSKNQVWRHDGPRDMKSIAQFWSAAAGRDITLTLSRNRRECHAETASENDILKAPSHGDIINLRHWKMICSASTAPAVPDILHLNALFGLPPGNFSALFASVILCGVSALKIGALYRKFRKIILHSHTKDKERHHTIPDQCGYSRLCKAPQLAGIDELPFDRETGLNERINT